jgi:LmbE family N-acetylglucosaminyl deacetylase
MHSISSAAVPAATPTTTVRTARDVAALGTVLGIWAHPDDEVYLSAGIMAAATEAGNRVVVVTATRGEHGTDDPVRWPPERLSAVRAGELAASLAALDGGRGRIEHRFLGESHGRRHVDGTLAATAPDGPVTELATIIEEIAPDTVLTFGPDGMTGHPDHRTVAAWTRQALRRTAAAPRLLQATCTDEWSREFGGLLPPMDGGTDTFPVTPAADLAVDLRLDAATLGRKVAALAAQDSQTGSLREALGAPRYRRFVGTEAFRRDAGVRSAPRRGVGTRSRAGTAPLLPAPGGRSGPARPPHPGGRPCADLCVPACAAARRPA